MQSSQVYIESYCKLILCLINFSGLHFHIHFHNLFIKRLIQLISISGFIVTIILSFKLLLFPVHAMTEWKVMEIY